MRYQLVVTPRSNDLKAAFDDKVRSRRDSISFTVHLYDKAGFELCKKDVKPTPFVDSGGRIDGLHANDTFYSFECSRSNYKVADHWSLGYVFPSLTSGAISASVPVPAKNGTKAKAVVSPTPLPEDTPSGWDDTLTGFDYLNGHLETLSGNTFLVRPGEQGIANMWAIKVQVEGGKQPSLHITCKTKTDCVIENTTNHQAVHGRRIG